MREAKPHKPRHAVLRRVSVYLLLGLILTVLTSWACSWWSLGEQAGAHFGVSGTDWIREVPSDWPEYRGITLLVPRIVSTGSGFGVRGLRIRERQGMHMGVAMGGTVGTMFINDDPEHVVDVVETGLPWKTMTHLGPDDARGVTGLLARGIPVPQVKTLWLKGGRLLPLVPLWPGFVASVFAWAAALFLALESWRVPGRIRRSQRRKQGRCLVCGYDLAGLSTCPECNTPSAQAEGAAV